MKRPSRRVRALGNRALPPPPLEVAVPEPPPSRPLRILLPSFVLMRGGSCIVAPLGGVLVAPHFEGEAILEAELDPQEIVRGKYDFDVAGHYARPDVFRLSVNEAAQPPVAFGVRGSD